MLIEKLIKEICLKPGLYLGQKSVIRARAFIDGYRLASLDNATVGSDSKVLHRFRDFVFEQYRPMSSAGWDEVLLQNSANDAEAFDIFCDLWNRFLSVTESTDL